jgi:uncharacterized protein YdiU (UPF0061 family)
LFNRKLAANLGLDVDAIEASAAQVLGGAALPDGAEPIAQAYAGHQFGHFTMLGDGRALLVGEQQTPHGTRVDIAFKGSGRTPYSRGGDGLAALGPMLREYLVSEAMFALGIPTTRSLAVVATGDKVRRDTMLDGAVLTRIAASHLRVGTFEYAARRDLETLRTLADYAIARHDAQLTGNYVAWLHAVISRQASLVARWMQVGFIHGVMNTDNMTLSGETIDYGPCAFMDRYDPSAVFSSIDHQGRYAYGNQPRMAHWNLTRFAESILPLLHVEQSEAIALAEAALATFPALLRDTWLAGMRRKLGLFTEEPEDQALVESLLASLEERQLDYTSTLRGLASEAPPLDDAPWLARWRTRLARQSQPWPEAQALMRKNNPAVIARNQRVEEAIAAAYQGDLSVAKRLLAVLEQPFEDASEHYTSPPPPAFADSYQTFCGT